MKLKFLLILLVLWNCNGFYVAKNKTFQKPNFDYCLDKFNSYNFVFNSNTKKSEYYSSSYRQKNNLKELLNEFQLINTCHANSKKMILEINYKHISPKKFDIYSTLNEILFIITYSFIPVIRENEVSVLMQVLENEKFIYSKERITKYKTGFGISMWAVMIFFEHIEIKNKITNDILIEHFIDLKTVIK
jgi:hypothetical protein